jgi:hypothetical protein
MPPEVKAILQGVPTTDQILEEVIRVLKLDRLDKAALSKDLDVVLEKMMSQGLRVLRRHQAIVTTKLVEEFQKIQAGDPEKAHTLIEKGFISMGNQRKKRAGVHMEKCVKWLLGRCRIPAEEAAAISGQSDLVVPSAEMLKERPERVVVLEFKRTTRERWKEVRDEIARTGLKVWLITLDDYLSNANVKLMAAGKMTLYVPDRVYQKLEKRKGHLRSLKSLVSDLEPFA